MKNQYRIVKETRGDSVEFIVERLEGADLTKYGDWKRESMWRNHDTIESARARVKDLQDRDVEPVVRDVVEVFE